MSRQDHTLALRPLVLTGRPHAPLALLTAPAARNSPASPTRSAVLLTRWTVAWFHPAGAKRLNFRSFVSKTASVPESKTRPLVPQAQLPHAIPYQPGGAPKDAPPCHGIGSTKSLLNLCIESAILPPWNRLLQAHGHWTPAMASTAYPAPRSVQGLIAAFNQHIRPSRSRLSTRSKHWDSWAIATPSKPEFLRSDLWLFQTPIKPP